MAIKTRIWEGELDAAENLYGVGQQDVNIKCRHEVSQLQVEDKISRVISHIPIPSDIDTLSCGLHAVWGWWMSSVHFVPKLSD